MDSEDLVQATASPAANVGSVTVPFEPSDALVEHVAKAMSEELYECSSLWRNFLPMARVCAKATFSKAWQPIDTAPKDRTEIVGFNSHTKTVSRTWWCHASFRTQEWKMVPRGTAWRPTHWLPMPPLDSSLTADPVAEPVGGLLEPNLPTAKSEA